MIILLITIALVLVTVNGAVMTARINSLYHEVLALKMRRCTKPGPDGEPAQASEVGPQ